MSEAGLSAISTVQELSRDAIASVDSTGQLADVLALPEHLRDALWRVESAIMQDWDTPAGVVVAGMGGSAIGGALARAALGDQASRPIFVTRACAPVAASAIRPAAAMPAAGAAPRRRFRDAVMRFSRTIST